MISLFSFLLPPEMIFYGSAFQLPSATKLFCRGASVQWVLLGNHHKIRSSHLSCRRNSHCFAQLVRLSVLSERPCLCNGLLAGDAPPHLSWLGVAIITTSLLQVSKHTC